MYRLFSLPLIIILFGCGQHNNEGLKSDSISISIDSVRVNAKDQFLYLNSYLRHSDLSEGKKFLFNFNLDKHHIEQIDLDKLELVNTYPMEKEGPDGIGTNIHNIRYLQNDTFYISSYERSGIVNLEGEKILDISFDIHDLKGSQISPSASLQEIQVHPNNTNLIYAIFNDWREMEYIFAKINLKTKIVEIIDLPEFNDVEKQYIGLTDQKGKTLTMNGPTPYLDLFEDQIYISNITDSAVYILDLKNDTLQFKQPNHKIFNLSRKGPSVPKTDSFETFKKEILAVREDINFSRVLYDPDRKLHFRFSFNEVYDNGKIEEGPIRAINYLSIFDSEFDLISEQSIESLTNTPLKIFVKDKKIWVYNNFEDEMGFLRLSIHDVKG
ncbi:MAG: DUF4221 domain-containing protein [Cytophagales bacterium]|uniref:DUF4221 family protein n=1 Tax=Cyclobacterium marinum TaxID=104 RepID=UPI0030DCDC85|nr:DUF4221 domain-containing protein [Cytophagales bacterium]|tara:strand:- start:4431 stop:5579 length:1149 start_codon:yes stop_codon:yes gene_type:complete